MRVLVKGLDDVHKALRGAPPEVRRELTKTLRKLAEPARRTARADAPRASGRLARSIRIKAGRKGALIGSPLAYAPVLEYAHKGRYRSLSARWGPPPRFLIPAIEDEAPRIEREAGDAIQGVLDKAFGGGGLLGG